MRHNLKTIPTMKSLRYLLISVVALFITSGALACWSEWYGPKGYYMYRVYPLNSEPDVGIDGWCYPGAGRNCSGWQKLTSSTIPLKDIYDVVYKMSIEDFEKIYVNRKAKYDNKFVEWITKKDAAILDFLLLAKTNEHIRLKVNSRWYYPTMNIDARMSLEEVAERSLSAKDARLRDRYLLQAVRALFSMQRYEECVALWEGEVSKLPVDNQMRELIYPYIAGAEYRLGRLDRAMECFAQIGDLESILFCANRAGEKLSMCEALDLVYKYAPSSPYIAKTLQRKIRSIEPSGEVVEFLGGGYYEWLEERRQADVALLRPYCMEKALECQDENQAMWYYTVAFLSDMIGDIDKATKYLKLAEESKSTPYIAESIKVMRIYMDAKLSTYDSAYEAKLFEQLRWLDSMVANNITEEVRDLTTKGYRLNSGASYYYWNDMLRRIVLAEVCPRMMQNGMTTRALQLANMADNRLLSLVDRQDYYTCVLNERGYYDYTDVDGSNMRQFRYAKNKHNMHDYSNHFFEMIDSLGLSDAKKYLQNVNAPKSDFDRYLNARGYTNGDYLNDIVGTHCLREMCYGEAVKYLSKVSNAYNRGHLNVEMRYNPFSVRRERVSHKYDTRLEFAREMYSLEQRFTAAKNQSEKAEYMFRFAVGLHNSFDRCWPLTQYYRGGSFWGCVIGTKRDWQSEPHAVLAIKRAEQMAFEASTMATDAKVAAEINFSLCNFKTVAEKYPDTPKGKLVRGKCDGLYDYRSFMK